ASRAGRGPAARRSGCVRRASQRALDRSRHAGREMSQPTARVSPSNGIEISGPAGPLEATIDPSVEPAVATAVICHPHPLDGGTMSNKVVTTVARAFTRLRADAVRFNFRGVGRSAGAYAEGVG